MGIVKNEFGDTITKNSLRKIAKQINLLSSERIDNLFYYCGWRDSERRSNMALPNKKLEKIKNDFDYAFKSVENLFLETPKKQFIKAFELRNKSVVKEKQINKMKPEIVKGFNDYEGNSAIKRAEIKKILVDTFEKYGFNPVETPIIEYEDFVKGENSNDEAISDIFKLQDKGKRNLALRYEFTFQLKRLMQNKKFPYKRYEIGEVFRDEPTSKNRYRQFVQCDVDVVGSQVKDEAEILSLAKEVFEKIGLDFIIYFNNRKLLNEVLNSENIKKQNYEKVIREIDKLDKIPLKEIKDNLKKLNATNILDVLKKDEKYFEKFSSYEKIKELIEYLSIYGIKAVFQPNLARGLSYYNGNVFEIKTSKMKETVCAGGSYEFNGVECTGISFGLDRLSVLSNVKKNWNTILVVSLNEDKDAIKIANNLRKQNNRVSVFYGKPSKALEYANSYNYNSVIFVGAKEIKQKKVKLKDMKTGKEKMVTLEKVRKGNLVFNRK